MKLHMPLPLRCALFALFALVALPTQADVTLNDYASGGWYSNITNENLTLNGDWEANDAGVSLSITQSGTYSLTGSGTISQAQLYVDATGATGANFNIAPDVQLKGTIVDVTGVNATYAGTVLGGTTEKTRFGAFGGAVFDLSGATFEGDALVSLRIGTNDNTSGGGTVLTNYIVNANHNLSLGCQTTRFNVLDGNLVLADSGTITFYNWSGETGAMYLDITGKVTITGESLLKFNCLGGNYQVPTDGTILMTCAELEGDLSQLNLQAQTLVEHPDGSIEGVYGELTGYSIKSMAYGDGYALYLAADTPSIPEPTTATLSLLALTGLVARRRRK